MSLLDVVVGFAEEKLAENAHVLVPTVLFERF